MAWVGFREVSDRFSHIDGELVASNVVMTPEGSSVDVVLRFYPWWEHPLYLAARERGDGWGFSGAAYAGARDVRVKAVDVCEVRLSRQREVTDIAFATDHPLLWPSSSTQTIYANSRVDQEALFAGLLELKLPYAQEEDFRLHIGLPKDIRPPFGMSVPGRLHEPVLSVLRGLGVKTLTHGAMTWNPLVAFLIGEGDYVIARDFELDVPDFEHKPEWFVP